MNKVKMTLTVTAEQKKFLQTLADKNGEGNVSTIMREIIREMQKKSTA